MFHGPLWTGTAQKKHDSQHLEILLTCHDPEIQENERILPLANGALRRQMRRTPRHPTSFLYRSMIRLPAAPQ